MTRPTRSMDWGFPRWRGYGSSREAVKVRLCDRHGCDEPGDCPAPKAPNSPQRWYFCRRHAAEYNAKWDYFEGLEKAEAEARERSETSENAGYTAAAHYGWASSGDGTPAALGVEGCCPPPRPGPPARPGPPPRPAAASGVSCAGGI